MPPVNTYDAIVVGSGISGGWAAKEFCEKGLKTLVLERGRNVEHIKDSIVIFISDAGHMVMLEKPQPVADILLGFLEGVKYL